MLKTSLRRKLASVAMILGVFAAPVAISTTTSAAVASAWAPGIQGNKGTPNIVKCKIVRVNVGGTIQSYKACS